jgi:hypothetical protein
VYYELHYRMFGPNERRKKTAREQRAGRERPHVTFWAAKAEKVGSLRPDFEFFSRRLLLSPALVFLQHPRTWTCIAVKRLAIPKVQRGFVTTSLDLRSFLARNRQRAQLVGREGDRVFAIIRAKPPPHRLGANQAKLPTTIQVLEDFAFEPGMRLVAEDCEAYRS